MAIAKKPTSNQMITSSNQITTDQKAFISGAKESATQVEQLEKQKTKPVMLRVDPEMLGRIDRAAKRVGLKRASFIISSALEKVDRMERE